MEWRLAIVVYMALYKVMASEVVHICIHHLYCRASWVALGPWVGLGPWGVLGRLSALGCEGH